MTSLKGPGKAQVHDGSNLRIAIVHARWNTTIISALVAGCRKSLTAAGVKDSNITVQDVPGSYELPFACQRIAESSKKAASVYNPLTHGLSPPTPLDAIIAVGVLIKGETMHFEYIADAASHGLMRVQLDTGIPVVFGLLTVLSEEQGKARAGLLGEGGGHCHGEGWGSAAVELGVKGRRWGEGEMWVGQEGA